VVDSDQNKNESNHGGDPVDELVLGERENEETARRKGKGQSVFLRSSDFQVDFDSAPWRDERETYPCEKEGEECTRKGESKGEKGHQRRFFSTSTP
jgi:hypothetical protein